MSNLFKLTQVIGKTRNGGHHLNLVVEHSVLDAEDQVMALQEDRQGLGLSRRHAEP